MTLGWLYESLEVLLPRAEQAGVRLLLENTPYCFRPTFNEMAGVVKEVNNDNLKIVYDVANAAYIQEDPVKTVLAGHAMMGLIHISDTGLNVWGHDPIGTGVIDFDALGKAVNETGLTKKVVLEIIREIEPLAEVKKGIIELKKRYWIV
jgi:sugar phosphate isomerase/epimerase